MGFTTIIINLKKTEMKSNFKMLEATGKQEAIISICDVMAENPVWLNKCKSDLFALLNDLSTTRQRSMWLDCLTWNQVRDLFIEIKTEYYNFKDITEWNF